MEIQFKHSEDTISQGLTLRIEDRLQKLAKFVSDDEREVRAEFELHRDSSDHHSDKKWQASLTVTATGKSVTSTAAGETEDIASDRAIEEMREVLLKKNNRIRSIERKRGMFWKLFSREK